MNKEQLHTPAILLDLDTFENNLKSYQAAADKYGKQIWPMVKTHKSTEIARIQRDYGVKGFLCGTLDECEALCNAGFDNLMYAYPVAGEPAISRVISLTRRCSFYVRVDDLNGARMLDKAAARAGVKIAYTIIIDSGLHRFGVDLNGLLYFAKYMQAFENMEFKGISTHPGHVYGCSTSYEVSAVTADETGIMRRAAKLLRDAGFSPELITSGSTPTFFGAVPDENINIFHPGNYVFLDNIQMSIECAREKDCALTVLATVISKPRNGLYIIDAGAKCLGLDRGAHSNNSIKGYGYVKGHPELIIDSLSEEVGKIHVNGKTNLAVGDKIEIIPNHACSAANMTGYYIGCRGNIAEKVISVDIRGNRSAGLDIE